MEGQLEPNHSVRSPIPVDNLEICDRTITGSGHLVCACVSNRSVEKIDVYDNIRDRNRGRVKNILVREPLPSINQLAK
jgi:hypothetical protein